MNGDAKKIERRARYLLLNKEIPQPKMEVVRSLLANDKILANERFGAIIDLIKNCPDKPQIDPAARKVETKTIQRKPVSVSPDSYPASGPAQHSSFVDEILERYAHLKLFKKKYLIHTSTFFRIGIKKRLVPSKKLYALMNDLRLLQEKTLSRIIPALEIILADPDAEDPYSYNLLRHLQSWMLITPLSKLDFSRGKWLDCPTFENEFRQYLIYNNFFSALDIQTKERVIFTVENVIRTMPDLAKETVLPSDSESAKNSKEKINLRKEKEIYDFIMALRTFLPTVPEAAGSGERLLSERYGINGVSALLNIIFEALVFRRNATENELRAYYSSRNPVIKSDSWECSAEILKKYGKDEESKKKHRVEQLKEELVPLDRIVEMIGMKFQGSDILQHVFEDQWKIINKRRQDPGAIRLEDFITYADECISFFEKGMLPFLDGSELIFSNGHSRYEGAVFTKNSFEMRSSLLVELLRDLNTYRTNVPNEKISKEEIRKIMAGHIKTMDHIHSFLSRIGSLFNSIAQDLQELLLQHEQWEISADISESSIAHEPVNIRNIGSSEAEGRPIPYYDTIFTAPENAHQALKLLSGKPFYSPSTRECIYRFILAFCYQMAYETFSAELFSELEKRRELRNQIKLLGGDL